MTSSPLPAPPAKRPNGALLTGILALLTAVAPLSIDMYLPAFPHMAQDLDTTATGIQLTMTAFLVGLALGQLLIGPLSDGVGRRKPLLIGSFVALLATVVCALAPNVEILTAARFLQGLGGAAGIVLARAIVSDTSRGPAAAKLLGVLTMISVIAPVVGPLAGGAILSAGSWRTVFWVLSILVLLMFLGALFGVRETLDDADRNRGGLKTTFKVAGIVLRNRNYTGYLLTFCFSFAGLFAYIAASPFVVQNILGLSETRFSLIFAMNAVAITIVSAVAAALAGKAPYRTMISIGLAVGLLAAAGMLITVANGTPMVPTLVLFAVFQGSMGMIFGNATVLALEEAGHHAGTGSAFLGSLQFLLAALVSPLVGLWGEETGVPMGAAMLGFLILAAASYLLLTRKAPNTVPDAVPNTTADTTPGSAAGTDTHTAV
ncbi:multidrug effflux MFS transporter [Arthrobacter sp. zg-Y1143]|uniref:multidrug effflux MFS transporter n=1 Tax=Arthrobacter sp. zg-Y1143 TaxID=3049065 RepID=UPI0024C3BD2F|nr:multidrug effflux MFS transporter [Arthrobacter sp. zg-Y1143]MDK1326411.1 multidrug effflux MFS transporter [Arthrobacter sp. zg-Y1143]